MPFTLAHAVVALPFRRSRLPAAGVAAGAMVPDLPLYAPVGATYETTHAVWAAPTVDVLLGLLLLVLWGVVLRPALLAVLPPPIAARWGRDALRPVVPRPTPALLVAVAIGALTHVVWDAFTHPGRWGTVLVPVLRQTFLGVPVASWCQYASSVLGLLVLALWGLRRVQRMAPGATPDVLRPDRRRAAAILVLAALVAGAVASAVGTRGSGVPAAAFAAATGGIDAAGAVLIVVGVWLGTRSRPA
jgi:Domain of unknown function (DUF4184)